MEKIDHILSIVLDNQAKLGEVSQRVGHLEGIVDQTFNKLDMFIGHMSNHEAELAALNSAVSRLEARLEKLEMQRA